MHLIQILGAVLMALLMVLPALIHKAHWKVVREFYATRHVFRLLVRQLVYSECGTVTVNYLMRGSGVSIKSSSTTPPTQAQASSLQVQKAVVTYSAQTDTICTITHNWGLDVSAPEYCDPDLSYVLLADYTVVPALSFTFGNTNAVVVTKNSVVGPCSVLVTLRRNSTEGQ
jgi:hypothetical protein